MKYIIKYQYLTEGYQEVEAESISEANEKHWGAEMDNESIKWHRIKSIKPIKEKK